MTSSDLSLTALNIDADFIKQAKGMGLETLGDIMDIKLPDLRKKKGFNYIWYSALLEILERLGLLEEFERRQL
ncbi:hypothetical protein BC792_112101 [Sphingobacterium allocomposti]|uniref:RNA polymerase alpha subunit n=1 Tax=Sphingobacterium allocomposti TaxID=415956 RepID=A0A5S5DEP7_9SPHI|nr:hypothetical protein [Sphingobacterium composti Yoo et al. 2007 non Ten et al. 2007]TYP94437.1 hypothetical protein BC792_112101 [Sphingobacterium composti Yoo et al. 2007 non Ten et al. 2007]